MLKPSRVDELFRAASAGILLAFGSPRASAAETNDRRWEDLTEQNRRLQEQVRAQQHVIDTMNARMAEVLRVSERHERELRGLEERVDAPVVRAGTSAGAGGNATRDSGIRITAEAGLGYFRTGRNGQFPAGAFRADDPMLAIETPVGRNVYFYSELKLLPRETNVENFQLGELYLEFEDVLARWGKPGLLSVRAGRLNIPFGEEYLARGPVANPLISHSLSDLWGCDEGIEAYGRIGPAHYVIAVQNGGVSRLNDFHSAKSVAVRASWEPARWLHVSGSAMRTGKLATAADNLSELWFGNGFFRALGPSASTTNFWANLFELDATARWKTGRLGATVGEVRFDDSDTRADNARHLKYGCVEMTQDLVDSIFVAARYSQIRAPRGYPLVGWGPMGAFFFRPGVLTEELRRMSVGLGFRFAPSLVLKVEYTWESGNLTTGASRDHEDFFGTQLAVKF